MSRLVRAVILLIVTFIFHFNVSTGYNWVTVKQGSELPSNSISIRKSDLYVGRAELYNTVQPVDVYNSSYAEVFNAYTKTYDPLQKFEVLTATENCQWNRFYGLPNVPENVVRVGRAWNSEPIYLISNDKRTASILKTSKKILPSYLSYDNESVLVCANNAIWVDATPAAIPENAIAVKKGIFVARLMGPSSYIPAVMRNDTQHYCSTTFNQIEIKSSTCQVLIGTSEEYKWQMPTIFERIPDNALVVGRNENDEFLYVGREKGGRSVIIVSFSSFITDPFAKLEILVRKSE